MSSGWAVVTGASAGIGLAFATELSQRGYSVLAIARRRDRLEALAKEAAKHGGRIESLSANLATEQGLALVSLRVDELGEIELLINNAGVAAVGDFVGASMDHEIGEIRLNVEAVVKLTQLVLGPMVERRHGAIIKRPMNGRNLLRRPTTLTTRPLSSARKPVFTYLVYISPREELNSWTAD